MHEGSSGNRSNILQKHFTFYFVNFYTIHKTLIMLKKELIKFYEILFDACSLVMILCWLKHVEILTCCNLM